MVFFLGKKLEGKWNDMKEYCGKKDEVEFVASCLGAADMDLSSWVFDPNRTLSL